MNVVPSSIIVTNRGPGMVKAGSFVFPVGVPVRVPLDFISSYGQIPHSTYDFREFAGSMEGRNEAGSLILDWNSPLSGVDGYGRHALWLMRGLQELGVEVRPQYNNLIEMEWVPDDIRVLLSQATSHMPAKVGVAFTLGYDPAIYNGPCPVKIAITQIETNRLPRVHVENVNRCNHVITTSQFGVDVFRRSGVRIPITAMTPGIDVALFPYRKRTPVGLFRVLMLGALTPRKNPLGAIRIFQRASQANPDWRLTIKTRNCPEIRAVHDAAHSDQRITVIVKEDSPIESRNRYYDHDCFLWPSKGEGVGLPPLEAMSTGMELVCSDSSGMSDYLSSKWAYPVRISHTESAVGPGVFSEKYVDAYGDVGSWWVPSEDHAVKQLGRCFDHWLDGKGKGRAASEYVHANHTYVHSARDIVKVVEQYAS